MNKSEVLKLVDSIMHKYASNYRSEAKEMVEEKLTSTNRAKVQIPALCKKCWWINRCDYSGNLVDCFLPMEDVQ